MSVITIAKHWSWTISVKTDEYARWGQRWLQRGKESNTVGMNVGKWHTYSATWRIKDWKLVDGGKRVWIKGVVWTKTPVGKAVIVNHLERTGPSAIVNVYSTIAPGLMVGRKNIGWRGYINSFKDF